MDGFSTHLLLPQRDRRGSRGVSISAARREIFRSGELIHPSRSNPVCAMKLLASAFLTASLATSGQPTAVIWEGQTLSAVADFRPHEWLLALKAKTFVG